MSKSVEQLLIALNKEYEIYQEVLELAKKKKRIIIEGRVKELDGLTQKEQSIIMSLGKLENIRESIVNNIAQELDIKSANNIVQLADYFNEKNKEKVLGIREKLAEILEDVKATNDLNSKLIQQSLEYIEFNKNLLTSIENQGSTYGSKADEKDVKKKTNLFDARI